MKAIIIIMNESCHAWMGRITCITRNTSMTRHVMPGYVIQLLRMNVLHLIFVYEWVFSCTNEASHVRNLKHTFTARLCGTATKDTKWMCSILSSCTNESCHAWTGQVMYLLIFLFVTWRIHAWQCGKSRMLHNEWNESHIRNAKSLIS